MRLGIRLQWLLAFGALLVLSFFPLFFAVSRLTQTSVANVREASARQLGRAIASHVGDASASRQTTGLGDLLQAQVDDGTVSAVAVYDDRRARFAGAGSELDVLPMSLESTRESSTEKQTPKGERLLVIVPGTENRASVAVLLAIDVTTGPTAALVRLMALYTGIVAMALLFLGYLSMTRLVVRPVEHLSRAASKVASGARTLDLPTSGASELVDLGISLRTMTDRLRSDEQSLRAKVAELETTTAELKSAQETVIRSERLASVGRLAAGLAHEIGNPIAAILGFEELLLDGDLPRDEQRDFLVRMKRETERINRVLRDLLDFARAPSRTAEVGEDARGAIDVAVDAAITLVGPQKELRGVAIVRELPAKLPLVAMDEERLEQVLLNLLLNAGDAAAGAAGKVIVKAEAKGSVVVLEVIDNGPGISDAVKRSLFEPFVTTKEVGKGTGLGLAVCRGLIEAANGTIVALDAEGGGARFILTLPVSKAPS